MEIVPAINATSFEDAKTQLKTILAFLPEGNLIHLDIVDGKFAPNITWGTPDGLQKLLVTCHLSHVTFELHLMVEMPEAVIDAWLRTGLVKRVVVHLEAMTDSIYILEKCARFGAEAMLAINPGTDVQRLLAHADDFKYMQILAVYPGLAGQTFKPEIIEKIKFLKVKAANVTIEVDGGMNPGILKQCAEAGASIFVSASYILQSPSPGRAFQELRMATNAD